MVLCRTSIVNENNIVDIKEYLKNGIPAIYEFNKPDILNEYNPIVNHTPKLVIIKKIEGLNMEANNTEVTFNFLIINGLKYAIKR